MFFIFKGWFVKLWECITTNGVLVLCTSNNWKTTTLSSEIGKWLVIITITQYPLLIHIRFEMVEDSNQGNKLITVWKMKN